MVFVDGTNLLTEMGKLLGVSKIAYSPNDDVLQMATTVVRVLVQRLYFELPGEQRVLRQYWFGSAQGSQEDALRVKTSLRKYEFEPMIFQKFKGGREKKVDIAVAKEMLINAFHHNCENVLLIAGDEDYVDLVNDIKRYGVVVIGAFFDQGRSPDLALACDKFLKLDIWGHNRDKLIESIKAQYPSIQNNES